MSLIDRTRLNFDDYTSDFLSMVNSYSFHGEIV